MLRNFALAILFTDTAFSKSFYISFWSSGLCLISQHTKFKPTQGLCAVISDFILPEMYELNLIGMQFQKDVSSYPMICLAINILRVEFHELLILNSRPVYWLEISQDFTTRNPFFVFFFFVELSEVSCIHRDKPNIIPAFSR